MTPAISNRRFPFALGEFSDEVFAKAPVLVLSASAKQRQSSDSQSVDTPAE